MNKIRAKMYVQEKTEWGNQQSGANDGGRVRLNPVYGDTPENKAFFAATPTGQIEMHVSQSAFDAFQLGAHYYVDFILSESEEK